jgi:hypothetical protein
VLKGKEGRAGPDHWLCCDPETYVPADPTSAVWYSNESAGGLHGPGFTVDPPALVVMVSAT